MKPPLLRTQKIREVSFITFILDKDYSCFFIQTTEVQSCAIVSR